MVITGMGIAREFTDTREKTKSGRETKKIWPRKNCPRRTKSQGIQNENQHSQPWLLAERVMRSHVLVARFLSQWFYFCGQTDRWLSS